VRLLILNAGSSSLKFALYEERELAVVARGRITDIGPRAKWRLSGEEAHIEEPIAAGTHEQATRRLLERLASRLTDGPVTVHRIVHGGTAFSSPARLDDAVLAKLTELEGLAPLHMPAALQAIAVTRERFGPSAPAIAVFDTALFQTLPAAARAYALPAAWRTRYGIHRYGFHGFAHQSLRDAALRMAGSNGARPRIVTVQLGRGCSMAAFHGTSPIATSMGFSPLEGLVMPTRAGSLDAAAALYLVQRGGLTPAEVLRDLNERSGLLGLSGISADPAELLHRAQHGDPDCALALDVFFRQLHQYLGAYAGLLGGLDVVAMGGGISEHVPEVRERLLHGLAWLGCETERPTGGEARAPTLAGIEVLSSRASRMLAIAVSVDEERVMAEQALAYLRTCAS
jgi:acetate kinase